MAEYIEREVAIAEIGVLIDHVKRNPYDSKEETYGVLCGLSHAMQRIKEEVPVADVVEVRHGEWIEHVEKPEWLEDDVDIHYECSLCGTSGIGETPYCHNCGAKMDGKDGADERMDQR